jgi:hypothetical protein
LTSGARPGSGRNSRQRHAALTPEEEQGLEEALTALDRGEGSDLEDVRADLDAIVRR